MYLYGGIEFLDLLIILVHDMIGCIQDLVYGIKIQYLMFFPNVLQKFRHLN